MNRVYPLGVQKVVVLDFTTWLIWRYHKITVLAVQEERLCHTQITCFTPQSYRPFWIRVMQIQEWIQVFASHMHVLDSPNLPVPFQRLGLPPDTPPRYKSKQKVQYHWNRPPFMSRLRSFIEDNPWIRESWIEN